MASEAEIRAHLDEMVVAIRPQARSEAWKVWQRAPHALEMDELESLALSGLASAQARWITYCRQNDHDPEAYQFFAAYALRRMRGSMLDWLRAQDWVTRSDRTRAKALRAAGQDLGRSEEELAAATGMDLSEVRGTLAAVASRPVSIDAEPHDVAGMDDVEGQAVVNEVLTAMAGVLGALPDDVVLAVVLRYYHGHSDREIAPVLGVTPDEVARKRTAAILKVHDAMLKAVA
jgi:RNA polymerase sigma factor FliA